tara:strand:- start:5018 stop:5179 length:162 start_codon:yes stop_codon:yes gene_type:complete
MLEKEYEIIHKGSSAKLILAVSDDGIHTRIEDDSGKHVSDGFIGLEELVNQCY